MQHQLRDTGSSSASTTAASASMTAASASTTSATEATNESSCGGSKRYMRRSQFHLAYLHFRYDRLSALLDRNKRGLLAYDARRDRNSDHLSDTSKLRQSPGNSPRCPRQRPSIFRRGCPCCRACRSVSQ
eukprot:Mycagemm_TRINITY_DN10058_c0_g1::TRINITY_DN10058_c0_g1_i2::g.2227::m.2227 type:complete len:130 gc:universal TRINITY_DN10058_c0_g1_i2:425-36(-)